MIRMIPSSIIRSTLKTVITTSGIGGTLFATVRWCGGVGTAVPTPPHQRKLANTLRPVPDVVIIICMCSLWWMMVSSETCRAVRRNIIKLYIVAFFGQLLTLIHDARTHEHKNLCIYLQGSYSVQTFNRYSKSSENWITDFGCPLLCIATVTTGYTRNWTGKCQLFCTMTNKCTIISQIITLLQHVSTQPCHPQGANSQYPAKLHQYFKCSSW